MTAARSTPAGYAEIALSDNHTQVQEPPQPPTPAKAHGHGGEPATKGSLWMLAFCCTGIMISFTLNGLVLEKMTNHRVLGELSLTFVFCLVYSLVALVLRYLNKEAPSTMPQSKLAVVGVLAFGSTISSMVALRYVTFITRILGKSCKSIPVMFMGVLLGKRYALKKYISVLVLSIGVAVFLVGTAHEKHHTTAQTNESHHRETNGRTPNMLLGFGLLMVSLLLDGATGALEDRFMEKYHIGAFDLMYTVNIWKCVFAGVGMVVNGELPVFVEQVIPSMPNLILLSATGALGQAFIFFTISKFGALTCSIIGTCRKVLSIVLSVVMFGHILSRDQFIGLALAFTGIGLNWVRMNACFGKKEPTPEAKELTDAEAMELLESGEETASSEGSDDESDHQTVDVVVDQHTKEVDRGLELVNAWDHQTQHKNTSFAPVSV